MSTTIDDHINIVKSKLSTSNFEILNVDVVPISATRLGFLGDHKILQISVKSAMCDGSSVLRFFVKSIPANGTLQLFVKQSKIWTKEPLMYLGLLKELQSLVGYKISARCFLARPDEIIVLEDLTLSGYRMNDQDQFDFEHCKVALECLACFHSASIIFEEKNNLKINELFPEVFTETLDMKPEANIFRRCTSNFVKTFQMLFDNYVTDISSEHKERIISLICSVPDMSTPSSEIRNVVNHMDLWNNNIMFSYEKDGRPDKACLVDFQYSLYAPPGLDVMFLLHMNTTQQFRSQYELQLLDHYYQHLSDQLRYAGLNSVKLISRGKFSSSCWQALPVALIIALVYLTIFLPPVYMASVTKTGSNFISYFSVDSTATVEKAFQESEQYRQTVKNNIQEVIQFLESDSIGSTYS